MLRIFRLWHRWISVLIAVPFTVTLITGIVLATRGFNTWVQPDHSAFNSELTISFNRILESARSVPEAKIHTWKDVSQIDVRPSTGNIRVRARHTLWEIQIDGATGAVTGKGLRRFSWLVSLHEGAYFGPVVRYGVFLPSALGVLFLLVSGVVIAFHFYGKKYSSKGKPI